ncbi:hypothetical protein LX15_000126 [Streptoalloteichus tenebrarius]|uniref:Uncharacterized protein n=1 Tax=Streptoalloteichus tenebrarius (strain ATCC 17920 / DSM 40477 / JCM 4838 / CBS 697.72 / NBRC 16177 / NCIMB 11028 / NRRL B-12390 / A12253. 1 / ISP 5477) TaxID=1933 RepID=A0ABT1HLR9_STRSD|nr:hypothetical protein [Streptoalloteichus tenebrarius]MCP2256443.1 hypothetical protein [Streptoalloteichus tenebrarius]BFF04794.1 hypothetical protein GCM10020241_64690 [Streptoalloteichus tenebrarius]
MSTIPTTDLRRAAEDCVELVDAQFGRHLDWSVDSLDELDEVCAELLAQGPLDDQRLERWRELVGSYTGEVLIRAYGGRWGAHEQAPGALAVLVEGTAAFPFGVAGKILTGEFASLASLARALPLIIASGRRSD